MADPETPVPLADPGDPTGTRSAADKRIELRWPVPFPPPVDHPNWWWPNNWPAAGPPHPIP